MRRGYLELRQRWPYGPELPRTRRKLIGRARAAGVPRGEVHCLDFNRAIRLCIPSRTVSYLHIGAGRSGTREGHVHRSDLTFGSVLLPCGRRCS